MSSSSEGRIRAVAGDVAPEKLGHTQCHEHIFLRKGPSFDVNPALCMDDYGKSLRELNDYRSAGGAAIVDAQPGGFGRDPEILRRLSEDSGVNVVAVTGFHKLCFREPEDPLTEQSVSALTERFCAEVAEGMRSPDGSRSPARAGVVKCAFVPGGLADPIYRRLTEAAARAAAVTGAPLMVHTEPDTDVAELLSFCGRFGVGPERMLICHLDRTRHDAAYHKTVLSEGCVLCYDSIHRYKYVSEEQELDLLHSVCDAGYDRQIVLSLDTTNQRLRAYGSPDMGLDYLLTVYRSTLEAHGFSAEIFRRMTVETPARILRIQSQSEV